MLKADTLIVMRSELVLHLFNTRLSAFIFALGAEFRLENFWN